MEETARLKRLLFIVSLSLLACLLVARMLYLYLDDTQIFPISTIKIVANYQYVSHEQLVSILEPFQQKSFYTLPVHQLYQQLMALPWAKKVEIDRLYPDTIKITLEEKKPVAIWNDKVLTDDGTSFTDVGALPQLTSLPKLMTTSQAVEPVFVMYEKMSELLSQHHLKIKVLAKRDNQAWEVILTNGMMLNLGKQDTLERMERFVRAYPILSERPGHLVKIDLRYPKGMAVKWEKL